MAQSCRNPSNRDFSLPRCRPESIPSPIIPRCPRVKHGKFCISTTGWLAPTFSGCFTVTVCAIGMCGPHGCKKHHQTLNVRDALLQYTYWCIYQTISHKFATCFSENAFPAHIIYVLYLSYCASVWSFRSRRICPAAPSWCGHGQIHNHSNTRRRFSF
jgi:hypothetical protein